MDDVNVTFNCEDLQRFKYDYRMGNVREMSELDVFNCNLQNLRRNENVQIRFRNSKVIKNVKI